MLGLKGLKEICHAIGYFHDHVILLRTTRIHFVFPFLA